MTPTTAGQLAYESSPYGWFRHGGTAVPAAYHELDDIDRGFWERVAKAAREPLEAEIARLKARCEQLKDVIVDRENEIEGLTPDTSAHS